MLQTRDSKRFIGFVLRSRNCYSAARNVLTLPHPKMFKGSFGYSGSEGGVQQCTTTVQLVFPNLSSKYLYSKVLFHETKIKPSIRYRSEHTIGKSVN